MKHYAEAVMERAMKIQEVILRATAKRITWGRGQPSPRRVPLAVVEQVLGCHVVAAEQARA